MSRLPKGCTNVGGSLASAMQKCRTDMISKMHSYGYQTFWPSALQLFESAWEHLPFSLRKRLITLNTPFGEPCCLRADITLAAVSFLASHFSPEERPLRLCYADRIYKTPVRPDIYLEGFQIGAELLGWEGEGADVELIFLLLQSMDMLGLEDSFLVLGDMTFIQQLLSEIDRRTGQSLLTALEKGSYAEYDSMLKSGRVDTYHAQRLSEIPSLKGDLTILKEAERLLPENKSLASLKKILSSLEDLGYANRLKVDLSLIRELNYYSGPIFDVYISRHGRSLGGGGRYDGLLSSYGILGQATGFALDLELIASFSKYTLTVPSIMVWSGGLSPSKVFSMTEMIRQKGTPLEISWNPNRDDSIHLARMRNLKWWVDLSESAVMELGSGEMTILGEWIGGI
ncbi:MAG: ATP phosphoribosyltransferase regulatory subunit [Synergistales bacterium]|nr:ATP phosphoribosyltransferase regulatory subunit [Synergistales bacterium]